MSLLNPEILHRIIFCWYKYQTEFLAVCQVQNCPHWWGPRHYVCELPSAKFHLWNSHTLGFARTHLHTHVCGIKALASTPPPLMSLKRADSQFTALNRTHPRLSRERALPCAAFFQWLAQLFNFSLTKHLWIIQIRGVSKYTLKTVNHICLLASKCSFIFQ